MLKNVVGCGSPVMPSVGREGQYHLQRCWIVVRHVCNIGELCSLYIVLFFCRHEDGV